MKETGLFEAKTNLSKIAERMKRTGEGVTLTKHGEPYVDLIPHQGEPNGGRSKREILGELEKLSRAFSKRSTGWIKADIEEGFR